MRNEVLGHALSHFAEPNFNSFYDTDTLIVILSKQTGHYVEADCWLAAENSMLAATCMGLGTCVIDSAVEILNLAFLKELPGIPTGMRAICPIIVGFPKVEIQETTHHDSKVIV